MLRPHNFCWPVKKSHKQVRGHFFLDLTPVNPWPVPPGKPGNLNTCFHSGVKKVPFQRWADARLSRILWDRMMCSEPHMEVRKQGLTVSRHEKPEEFSVHAQHTWQMVFGADPQERWCDEGKTSRPNPKGEGWGGSVPKPKHCTHAVSRIDLAFSEKATSSFERSKLYLSLDHQKNQTLPLIYVSNGFDVKIRRTFRSEVLLSCWKEISAALPQWPTNRTENKAASRVKRNWEFAQLDMKINVEGV